MYGEDAGCGYSYNAFADVNANFNVTEDIYAGAGLAFIVDDLVMFVLMP